MIVPQFWAEAKERLVMDGRARTFKRFGWSDDSQQAALENAQKRLREAVEQAKRGEQVRLIDHRVAYNGAEGLPIREEVIERHGDTVITRNGYGALCLNTPRVLFADIDVAMSLGWPWTLVFYAAVPVAGALTSLWLGNAWIGVVAGFVLAMTLSETANRRAENSGSRREKRFLQALQRVEQFSDAHRDWAIRVYRTPNGYRLLVEHEPFDASDEKVFEFMDAVGTDKLYIKMCRNQKCFRARLSPKPWRIGAPPVRPRKAVWPLNESRLLERARWVQEYEAACHGFAACRYEKTLGDGRSDLDCRRVRDLHDDMSGALRSLDLA